ncbi:hypothetical protein [Salinibacter ruber]|nr:hypothetical protein [Salinibacter ruber]MBB4062707.1 hypothetical protein [Salinibacter ruber]MBB4070658.1 hypothetical protein [Salinibacter ruber]MCS3639242.1 hypothetical protein [Salinibacter ruber]MCS3645933.1 hypothetical protein [Salinibacter ruber]MCS3656386.1 hypothetical protein [Salinibacter ruber]
MRTSRSSSLLRLFLASLLFLGLGALTTVHAQDTNEDAPGDEPVAEEQGAGFFAVGTQFTDLAPLNDRLGGAGYPTFASEMVSLGGGGYGVVANRLMLGGEGHGLLTADGSFQGRNVSVGGGYGLFNLGYLFRPASGLRVYPLLGLGGGGLQLDIENAGTADDFDDVLDNPNRSASVGQASFLVSLGGGLEYQFGTPGEGRTARLGLRAGYMVSALRSDWQLGDSALAGGPDASMQGPFLRLTIGGISDSDDE